MSENISAAKVVQLKNKHEAIALRKEKKLVARDIKRDYQLYIMLVPTIAVFLIFVYFPFYGVQIAFKDYNLFLGIEKSKWIGFTHFETFFTGPYFWQNLKNTFLISLYGMIFGFPASIIFALSVNELKNKTYRGFVQTASYLPYFVSAVVVASLVINFLSPSYGIVNRVIGLFGVESKYFMIMPEYFRTIYTAMGIWHGMGFNSIIFLAALSAIDVQLYEAATIDGANKWKQIVHITMPGIMPTIVVMLILRIGQMLNVGYETIILLYQPATYVTADVISSYVYRLGIVGADYGYATAVDLFNSVVACVLVITANKISNKVSEMGIW